MTESYDKQLLVPAGEISADRKSFECSPIPGRSREESFLQALAHAFYFRKIEVEEIVPLLRGAWPDVPVEKLERAFEITLQAGALVWADEGTKQ